MGGIRSGTRQQDPISRSRQGGISGSVGSKDNIGILKNGSSGGKFLRYRNRIPGSSEGFLGSFHRKTKQPGKKKHPPGHRNNPAFVPAPPTRIKKGRGGVLGQNTPPPIAQDLKTQPEDQAGGGAHGGDVNGWCFPSG